jgi:hypothetical protein
LKVLISLLVYNEMLVVPIVDSIPIELAKKFHLCLLGFLPKTAFGPPTAYKSVGGQIAAYAPYASKQMRRRRTSSSIVGSLRAFRIKWRSGCTTRTLPPMGGPTYPSSFGGAT